MLRTFLFISCFWSGFHMAFSQKSQQPIVILVSLDGFRHDYVERFKPENLGRFIASGTAANALIPSFPSKTFPNHYTIATGMLPEHHGLVDNSFYEPKKDQVYTMFRREIVQDGYWYGGLPLWVLAEQHGLKATSYFFVGSEAPVQGIRPSEYFDYDGRVPNLTRISKVFEWLQLPEPERPRLITLYFSDMDDVGHAYGPDHDEKIKPVLQKLDRELGALFEGIKSFDLPIHVIVVSDHGMATIAKDKLINLNQLTQGIQARVVNNGALAHLYLENPKEKQKIIRMLRQRSEHITIDDLEGNKNYLDTEKFQTRIGDLLIVPDFGHYLADNRGMMRFQNKSALLKTEVFGEHGFSPKHSEMWGIFYAQGPMIKEGHRIAAFHNIHIYPLVCKILGLPVPGHIDGNLEILAPILK